MAGTDPRIKSRIKSGDGHDERVLITKTVYCLAGQTRSKSVQLRRIIDQDAIARGVIRHPIGQQMPPSPPTQHPKHRLERGLLDASLGADQSEMVDDRGAGELCDMRLELDDLMPLGEELDVPAHLLAPPAPTLQVAERQPTGM